QQEPIPCQATGNSTVISENDKFVFIDDFGAKQRNEYILYFGNKSSLQKFNHGIIIEKTKNDKAEKILNGIICAEIQPNSQITFFDAKSTQGILRLNGIGGRYEGRSSDGSGKLNWTEKGIIYCRGEIRTHSKATGFCTVFEFFYNSPYVKISYSSDNPRYNMDERSYRPLGTLLGTAFSEALVISGWTKKYGYWPIRNNTELIIRQKNTIPFGWLLAYSDIPEYPRLYLSKKDFILEFALYHGAYIAQSKPQVSWVYVHNVSSESEIDNYAKRVETALLFVVGLIETTKND
ncbi:MAG: hypothetical protein PHV82_12590, partial [Victivallaceae bacterium]|nr:hypothetical protein [Victivallaceae bacterium]